MDGAMKKLLILLVTLVFLTSCIKVVIEPYWDDKQKEKKSDYLKRSPTSDQVKRLH